MTQQPWQEGEGAATVLVTALAKLGARDGAALYDAAARARMMTAGDIADCVLFCIHLPPRVVIEEMLIRPK